jgi:hypothetical protein
MLRLTVLGLLAVPVISDIHWKCTPFRVSSPQREREASNYKAGEFWSAMTPVERSCRYRQGDARVQAVTIFHPCRVAGLNRTFQLFFKSCGMAMKFINAFTSQNLEFPA